MSVTKANGDRYLISSAEYVAEVTEVGAALRLLRYDERDLVTPFPDDAMWPFDDGVRDSQVPANSCVLDY